MSQSNNYTNQQKTLEQRSQENKNHGQKQRLRHNNDRQILQKQKQEKYIIKNEQGKYLGNIPYIGTRTKKFIKVLKQYNVNTGIKNYLPLLTQINNNKTEITDKSISVEYTNSTMNYAT